MSKPILCLDFDGVIHRYTTPWTDAVTISDDVTEGFFEWAEEAAKHFTLVVYSSRSKDPKAVEAMREWFHEQCGIWLAQGKNGGIGFPLNLEFVHEKPAAFLTIDDRAIRFEGDWSKLELEPKELLAFRPWNKRRRDS
jgi:hypothetical protein